MYNIQISSDTNLEKLKLILDEFDRREEVDQSEIDEPGKCCELCGREHKLKDDEDDKYEIVLTKTGRIFTVCTVCGDKLNKSPIEMK